MAVAVVQCHVDVRAQLRMSLASDRVNACSGIKLLQKRLAKALEAFWAQSVNGERLVERDYCFPRGVAGSGKKLMGVVPVHPGPSGHFVGSPAARARLPSA